MPIQRGLAGIDSVMWTVPGVSTDSAAVRVTGYDAAGQSTADFTDGLFRIVDLTGVPAVGRSALALRLAPNPASAGRVHLRVSLPGAGDAAVEVLTASERRLWRARLSPWRPRGDLSGQDPTAERWRWESIS